MSVCVCVGGDDDTMLSRGTRGVMVIIIGDGHSDLNSNHEGRCLHFT